MHLKSILPDSPETANLCVEVQSAFGDRVTVEADYIEWAGRNVIAILGFDARINVDAAGARDLAVALLKLADHVDGVSVGGAR